MADDKSFKCVLPDDYKRERIAVACLPGFCDRIELDYNDGPNPVHIRAAVECALAVADEMIRALK